MHLHSLLQTSINEYTDILALMGTIIEPGMNNRIDDLNLTGKAILEKQQHAFHTDKKIMEFLKESPESCRQDGIEERAELIHEVIQLNKQILPKLESVKSLISSELRQIKNGRSAMKGYQSTEDKNGRNVNNML